MLAATVATSRKATIPQPGKSKTTLPENMARTRIGP